jgi:pimeloyl-ACP methyl ester carboxylesterase
MMIERAPQPIRSLLLVCLLATFVALDCAAAGLQRHSITVDGHVLALWSREVSKPKGVILLLHGRTWSALPNFDLQVAGQSRSVMQALNKAGYAAYALDLRGYGATPRDASGWLTPDRAAADLAEVLAWIARRERQTPALLGYSMGSVVAQLTAQRRPELVADLILFGYPRDPANPPALAAVAAQPPREVNTRERAQSDFISPAVTPTAVIEAYVTAALAADPIRVDWREQQQFAELDPARVRAPTLLLHGERDPLTPAVAQARLFTQLGNPDRRWVILAGGDHAALVEDTQPAFIAAIVAFLSRPKTLVTAKAAGVVNVGD